MCPTLVPQRPVRLGGQGERVLDQLPTSSIHTIPAARPLAPGDDPTGRRSRRTRAAAIELAGIALTVTLGLVALAHLVVSARSAVFFTSGDSLLMPLVERSLREGEAQHWAMSSVLFVFPEIPVYVMIASVVPGVHAALIVNAIVTLVLLYCILRGLAGAMGRRFSRRTHVVTALVPIAALTLASLLEHTSSRGTLELVTLFFTTTYYYGTTLALVAAVPLTVAAATAATRRRRVAALAGLAALGAASTFSNPLFALWATAPIAVALVVLARLIRRRPAAIVGVAALSGTGAGYLGRIPVAKYLSHSVTEYFRIDLVGASLRYYVDDYFATASTWQGAVEMSLLAVATTGTIVVAIIALVRRWPTRTALGLAIPAASVVVTAVAAVLLGTMATRYLMPLFFAPAASFVVLAAHAIERVPQLTGLRPRWPARRILVAGVTALALVASGASVAAVRIVSSAPSTQAYAPAICLSNWIAGRDVTGAGAFWTIRALKTYGDRSVKLLQITGDYNATLWLDDAADYTGQRVSYLVVDANSHFSESPSSLFGRPSSTVTCGQYTILDYQGTTGADVLTQRIAQTAETKIAERHL
jgi:hypothetical protein